MSSISLKLFAGITAFVVFGGSIQAAPVVETRSQSGIATWFEVGLGACGKTNDNSDYIVALQTEAYSNGAYCGESITISASVNGETKTAIATVADECPTCEGAGSIDMSPSLFKHFTSLDEGVIDVKWDFNTN